MERYHEFVGLSVAIHFCSYGTIQAQWGAVTVSGTACQKRPKRL